MKINGKNPMEHIAATMPEKMASTLVNDLTKHTRIGLAGAQRTGKTTLAEHYSTLTGLPFIPATVSAIMAEIGFDSSATYDNDFKTRLDAQFYLLGRLDEEWSKVTGGFISDRTPLCMAMYTLADIVGTTELSDSDSLRLLDYIDQCKLLTMKHFDTLVSIKLNPRITLVPKVGSAPAKPHHILHLESLLSTLILEINVPTGSDPRNVHDICGFGILDNALHKRLVRPAPEPLDSRLGSLENLVRENLTDKSTSTFTVADLPFSACTVEERLHWLHALIINKTFNWVADAVGLLKESPMLTHAAQTLSKTVDDYALDYE